MWRNACTSIGNGNAKDSPVVVGAAIDTNIKAATRLHRFKGIHAEVEEKLSELRCVRFNKRQMITVSNAQGYAGLFHLTPKQSQSLLNGGPYVNDGPARFRGGHSTYARNQLIDSLDLLDDDLGAVSHTFVVIETLW